MTPDFLALPWKIQIALGAGYAAYTLAYVGLRKFHTASDVFFKTILFSLIASGVFLLRIPVDWAMECAISILATVLAGIFWNIKFRYWYIKLLRQIGIHSNDLPTAWLSISHDQEHNFTGVAVLLTDGTWLRCDDLATFKDSPLGPATFGADGDIAIYVTHIEKPGQKNEAAKVDNG